MKAPSWALDSRYRTFGVVVLIVALTAAACSKPKVEDTHDAVESSASASGVSLSDVSLDSSAIGELDIVRFNGVDLDGDLSKLELEAIVDGVEPSDMLLYVDGEGLYSIFPLHPQHPGSGGEATLRLSAGEGQTREFDVTVSGLPEAHGAWNRAIDTILEELDQRAGQLGTSLSELSNTAMSDVGDDAAIIKLIAGYVDNGTKSDLESLLDRPAAELSVEQMALVDSIVAKIDPLQLIPPPPDAEFLEAMTADAQTVSLRQEPAKFNAVRAAYAQGGNCRTPAISIGSEVELAAAVAKGVGAKRLEGGAVEKLTQDVAALSQGLGDAKNGLAVAGAAGPVVSGAAAFVGAVDTMYATMGLWFEADAGNYPTMFTSLTANVSTRTFNEDYVKPGNVSGVSVVAASTGFDASEGFSKVASSAANAAIGAGVGKLAGDPGAVETAVLDAGGILRGAVVSETIKYGSQDLTFCPQQWTVVLKSPTYADVSAVIGRIKVDKNAWTYEPVQLGEDILRVRARSDAFSGLTASMDTPIDTKRLQVIATPSEIKVKKAGDTVDIKAELKNADTKTLRWRPRQGRWDDGGLEETNGPESRLLNTPTNKSLYPFPVVIESTSRTGLRREATDIRSDQVWITLKDLIVLPDPGEVQTRQQLQFVAVDGDGNPREVTWEATGGTISSSGLYTAGRKPGVFSVTATAKDDPSTIETVSVVINDGECLVGTWLMRSQEFFDQMGAQFGGEVSYRSGENRLIMWEDGTYTAFRNAWSFSTDTPDGSIVWIITAEDSGRWTNSETDLIFNEDNPGDPSVELLMDVDGTLMPFPVDPRSMEAPDAHMSGQLPYTCEADVLTTVSGGVTSIFDRVSN